MDRREFSKLVGAAAVAPVLGPSRVPFATLRRWSFTQHLGMLQL